MQLSQNMNIHENGWRNNFQYKIKIVTFAFAFASDEISKEREKRQKLVMNFNRTPSNGKSWCDL